MSNKPMRSDAEFSPAEMERAQAIFDQWWERYEGVIYDNGFMDGERIVFHRGIEPTAIRQAGRERRRG